MGANRWMAEEQGCARKSPRVDIILTAEDGVSDVAWGARVQRELRGGRHVLAVQGESEYSKRVVGTGDGLSDYSWYKLDTFRSFEEFIFRQGTGFDVDALRSRSKERSLVAWNDELKVEEQIATHLKIKEAGLDQLVVLYGRGWDDASFQPGWEVLCEALSPTSIAWFGNEDFPKACGRSAHDSLMAGRERVVGTKERVWNIVGDGKRVVQAVDYSLSCSWSKALNELDFEKLVEL